MSATKRISLKLFKMEDLFRILSEYRFIKTANVIYQYQNLNLNDREDRAFEDRAFEDGSVVFVERCFAMDIPKTGEAVIWKGNHFRVATIWHDKDNNCIEIDLNDL